MIQDSANHPIDPAARAFWAATHPGESYEEAIARGQRARQAERDALVHVRPPSRTGPGHPKRRSIAVILAVGLSWLSYLYTYSCDKERFWTCMAVTAGTAATARAAHLPVLGLVPVVVWLVVIVDRAMKPAEFYSDYPNGS